MYALPRPVVRDPPRIITLLDAAVSSAYRFSVKDILWIWGVVVRSSVKITSKMDESGKFTESMKIQLHAYGLTSPVTLCPQPQRHNVWCPLRATVSHCQPTGGPERWESPSLK